MAVSTPAPLDDQFAKPQLFWLRLSKVEQGHVVDAYTFKLGKVLEQAVRQTMLANLANINGDLCARVACGLGLPPPGSSPVSAQQFPIAGRSQVGSADAESGVAGMAALRVALLAERVRVRARAKRGNGLGSRTDEQLVERMLGDAIRRLRCEARLRRHRRL